MYFHHVIEKRQWIPVEYVYFRMRGVKIESKRPVMGISEFFGLLVSEITNSLLRLLFKKQAREVRERLRDALPALIYTKFAKWRKY
ncbi:MAG: hypothetical protein BroJett038_33210 [Chloroflexota bacterium]|nr:MAG: hypothetical protein BroJett038_33210 [Chloroflexota bacterium]